MKLSLCHLTLANVDHPAFIAAAAAAGVDHVCLFPKTPMSGLGGLPTVDSVAQAREIRARLDDVSLSVCNADAVYCTADLTPADYVESFAIAAALGAKGMTCLITHPDADADAALQKVRALADKAQDHGLRLGVEFSPRNQTRNVADSVALLQALDHPSVFATPDSLHLIRGGDTPADLALLDPVRLYCAQISDGPAAMPVEAQRDEALRGRLYPGEGALPLVEYVAALPDDIILAIEAPDHRLDALPAEERAHRAVAGTRAIMRAAGKL